MTPIRLVIPDTGPLISLARVNALELLLVFDDAIRVVITDFVEFESTRHRDIHPDAKVICSFIERYAGRVEIEPTDFGQFYKKAAIQREIFESTRSEVQESIRAAGLEPQLVPDNIGEETIIAYVRRLIEAPPGVPVLVLAEDDYLLRDDAPLPGNMHTVSTRSFLEYLEKQGKIHSAKSVWRAIVDERPDVNRKRVDRPARKIDTDWKSTVSLPKLSEFRKNRGPTRVNANDGGANFLGQSSTPDGVTCKKCKAAPCICGGTSGGEPPKTRARRGPK